MVTDTHRGIYFGWLVWESEDQSRVKLEKARHCFYFPVAEAGHRGVYGLATVGPGEGAKIGPAVTMVVRDVAKIVDCTEAAVAAWDMASW